MSVQNIVYQKTINQAVDISNKTALVIDALLVMEKTSFIINLTDNQREIFRSLVTANELISIKLKKIELCE